MNLHNLQMQHRFGLRNNIVWIKIKEMHLTLNMIIQHYMYQIKHGQNLRLL